MAYRPLTQNYQIRYGNTYGEGVFLGGRAHGIAFAQNASRGLSAIAEFLVLFYW